MLDFNKVFFATVLLFIVFSSFYILKSKKIYLIQRISCGSQHTLRRYNYPAVLHRKQRDMLHNYEITLATGKVCTPQILPAFLTHRDIHPHSTDSQDSHPNKRTFQTSKKNIPLQNKSYAIQPYRKNNPPSLFPHNWSTTSRILLHSKNPPEWAVG